MPGSWCNALPAGILQVAITPKRIWYAFDDKESMRLMSFVLIEHNDQYLLIKEASEKWNGCWFFPGGKVEPDESPEVAAIRETSEEAGCVVSLEGLIYFRMYPSVLSTRMHLYYKGNTDGLPVKKTADKHSLESGWFNYEQVSRLRLRQDALQVIDAYRAYKTAGIPVHHFHIVHK